MTHMCVCICIHLWAIATAVGQELGEDDCQPNQQIQKYG